MKFLAWSGWVMSMLQCFYSVFRWMNQRVNRSNLESVRDSLISIREICSDALIRREAINTEQAQQWVRQLQISVLDAQRHLEDVIGRRQPRQ